jgi:carboxyl-terminal processing protease
MYDPLASQEMPSPASPSAPAPAQAPEPGLHPESSPSFASAPGDPPAGGVPAGAPPARTGRPRPERSVLLGLGTVVLVAALVVSAFVGGRHLGRSELAAGTAGSPVASSASVSTDVPAPVRDKLSLLYEALGLVEQNYVDRPALDPTTLTYGAIRGLLQALDDPGHSDFMTPEEVASQEADLSGKYVGIGVELSMRTDGPAIVGVFEGSPAEKAGLVAGDRILAVAGQDATTMSFDALREKVRGPAGSTVTLSILHPGAVNPVDVVVSRAEIQVPTTTWAMVPGTQTALVRFQQFSTGSADELKSAIRAARDAGATSIALDLRGNPGGYVDQAVAVASQFLSSGVVYIERDARGDSKSTSVQSGGIATDIPLVVLVDEGTASSAEIVSGALQDAGRAKLVGTKTFGTGTVVGTFKLSDGSAVRIGMLEWLTPKARRIWRQGILPDVTVALAADAQALTPSKLATMTPQQLQASTDAQLLAALRLLAPVPSQAAATDGSTPESSQADHPRILTGWPAGAPVPDAVAGPLPVLA